MTTFDERLKQNMKFYVSHAETPFITEDDAKDFFRQELKQVVERIEPKTDYYGEFDDLKDELAAIKKEYGL